MAEPIFASLFLAIFILLIKTAFSRAISPVKFHDIVSFFIQVGLFHIHVDFLAELPLFGILHVPGHVSEILGEIGILFSQIKVEMI